MAKKWEDIKKNFERIELIPEAADEYNNSAKTCKYFFKLDVRKYFYNINHAVLKNQLKS